MVWPTQYTPVGFSHLSAMPFEEGVTNTIHTVNIHKPAYSTRLILQAHESTASVWLYIVCMQYHACTYVQLPIHIHIRTVSGCKCGVGIRPMCPPLSIVLRMYRFVHTYVHTWVVMYVRTVTLNVIAFYSTYKCVCLSLV